MSLRWHGDRALAAAKAGGRVGLMRAGQEVLRQSRARAPVDSGALRASGSVAATDSCCQVRYSAPHAALVHQGTSKMPARPFLKEALSAANVAQLIMESIKL